MLSNYQKKDEIINDKRCEQKIKECFEKLIVVIILILEKLDDLANNQVLRKDIIIVNHYYEFIMLKSVILIFLKLFYS